MEAEEQEYIDRRLKEVCEEFQEQINFLKRCIDFQDKKIIELFETMAEHIRGIEDEVKKGKS